MTAPICRWLAVWLLSPCIAACSDGAKGGTDVGNGATAELDVKAFELAPGSAGQSITLGDGARIDALWMVFERIRLRRGTSCEEEASEIDVAGPLVAAPVGEGVVGGAPRFPIVAGAFCGFEAKMHKLDGGELPAGAPAELVDLSILLQGARADGTSFVVRTDVGDEFGLEAQDGAFQLGAGNSALFLAYDVATWMAALDLEALPGGSTIEVSDQENEDRLSAFEDAVEQSARLFRDGNANGELEPTEHAPGQELAD